MKGVTPIFLYSGDSLEELNDRMWRDIQKFGKTLTFGTPKKPEKWKIATEIFAVTQIYGEALTRLYNGDVPEGWKFCGEMAKQYNAMLLDPDPGEQYYTYGQRLRTNNSLDAIIKELSDSIESGVQNNRIVGTIWNWKDIFVEDPPCFQWFQTRLQEDNLVSLRTLFRSHCFVNGDFANYGAILRFFIDEIIEPAGGELSELINVSTSAQIGRGDVNTVFERVGNWFNWKSFFNMQ